MIRAVASSDLRASGLRWAVSARAVVFVMYSAGRPWRGCAFRNDRSDIDRHKTPRTNMRQWERDGSCFDHLSPCLSQFYCWLPRRMRQQRRGYASGGIFTTAEADFITTEVHTQASAVRAWRAIQAENPPAIRFIASTPLATRSGVVSSVMVRAVSSKTHDGARDRTRRIGLGGASLWASLRSHTDASYAETREAAMAAFAKSWRRE